MRRFIFIILFILIYGISFAKIKVNCDFVNRKLFNGTVKYVCIMNKLENGSVILAFVYDDNDYLITMVNNNTTKSTIKFDYYTNFMDKYYFQLRTK